MAILAIFSGNITQSQYEALRKEVLWESQHPPGGIVHACGFDEGDRLHVADVWESGEAMQAFVEQRLLPGFSKLGIPAPDVTVYPLHNLNAYPAIEKYRV